MATMHRAHLLVCDEFLNSRKKNNTKLTKILYHKYLTLGVVTNMSVAYKVWNTFNLCFFQLAKKKLHCSVLRLLCEN